MKQNCASIDFSLLERLTRDFVCSRCFRIGVHTPVTQILSRHHHPKTLCSTCTPLKADHARARVLYLNGRV